LPETMTGTPITIFAKAFVPASSVVVQTNVYTGDGTYPTNRCTRGQKFQDTYYLHIPADAPAGEAPILFGLYDEPSGQRLTATGADADPGGNDFIQLGTVTIQP